jgi:23S rRNA (cytosine1962-C5)-methyltransferase
VTVTENGTRYRVHFGSGHKTGFFCDQRENRKRVAELCRGQSVLDVCCYTGGFAVMAAKLGGATDVTGIDLDEEPLKFAKQNAALNDVRVKFTQADAFAYMRDMLRSGRQFDMVVLDPPKLIRSRAEIEEGTKKHFDLNRLAMQLVKPGGLMLSCSCAGLLPEEEFVRLVRSAASSSTRSSENPTALPRPMQILARTGAAACHPVSGNFPEAEYLKAVWMRLG